MCFAAGQLLAARLWQPRGRLRMAETDGSDLQRMQFLV
jgi:hypothetical protein